MKGETGKGVKLTMSPAFALSDLLGAIESACDWLKETPRGTDQWERGKELGRSLSECKSMIEALPHLLEEHGDGECYCLTGEEAKGRGPCPHCLAEGELKRPPKQRIICIRGHEHASSHAAKGCEEMPDSI